ncbi:MAG: anti sigma factor C-terminal domain-containing protein [Eubacteriaceae bacterium]|nr:anti sigma factor C-terminal domain-containing protein [Eubacteriaceae bacterium]
MTFKEKLEKYRAGELTEQERNIVEEEIEKISAVNEYLDEEWQDNIGELFTDTDAEKEELKNVKTKIKRNNLLIVLTSIIAFAAIYTIGKFAVIPFLESRYWSPAENTFDLEYVEDIDLAVSAYSEMFSYNRYIGNIYYEKTGFAKYEIAIQHGNASTGDIQTFYATSDKGELDIKHEFWGITPANAFANACWPEYPLDEENKQRNYDNLSALPDFITVTAAVSFNEDMDMSEVISLHNDIREDDGHIIWIGIRNCAPYEQRYPLFGIAPFIGGYIRDEINELYPYFDVKWVKDEDMTSEILKTHTNSILSLCIDLHEKGLPDAFVTGNTELPYLEDIRGYLNENGIYSYGCYITAPAKVFIELIDSGVASQVRPEDAYIKF